VKMKRTSTFVVLGVVTASLLQFAIESAHSAASFSVVSTSPTGTLLTAATSSVSGTKVAGSSISYTATAVCPGSPTIKVTTTPDSSAKDWLIPITGLPGGIACSFTVTTTDLSTSPVSSVTSDPKSFTPESIPAAPTVGTTVGGKNSMSLNWTAPTNTGGLPISSYTITNETLGTTSTAPASATGTNIPALTEGAVYSFTVQANNSLGASAKASYQQVTVPSAPSAPAAPNISLVTGTTSDLSVSWTPPSSDGGSAITYYTVTLIPTSGSSQPTRISVTTLTSGLSHTFTSVADGSWSATVTAENVINPGAPSVQSAPITLGSVSNPGVGGSGGSSGPPPMVAPVPSVSATPTPTISSTPSASASPTPSPSVSSTPSATPTPSQAATPTPTPTSTPIATPSQTASANKSVGGGITVVGSSLGKSATKIIVTKPGNSIAKAPQIGAVVGKAITPTIKALPKSTAFKASVVINAKSYTLGSVKTNSSGVATLPAFSAAKAGTYSVQLTTAKGVKYFIKLVVKSKK
jgi:Fibronectin type III domain